MQPEDIQKLRALTSFNALVDYLRDELDWPIEAEDAEEVTFDYDPKELGIDSVHAVKIDTIKQIRPLAEGQPWGVFYIEFETKSLPVVVLRRILRALVPTSRLRDPNRPAWQMSDLLFICSQGEENNRSLSFAHFNQSLDDRIPELHTFSWDSKETHFYYLKNFYLEALRWPEDESDTDTWQREWEKAFTVKHRYVIRTAQSLASEMANMAATIRDLVLEIYDFEHAGGQLHKLHHSFKTVLIHDLSVKDFADMYAQTVTYGLFSAGATHEGDFSIQDVVTMIPNTNPFLKELLEELTTQDAVDLEELGVGQLVQLLHDVDMKAILRDFGRQSRGEDPVIHFYETFLKEYDAEKKVKRGVFYTPDPVVSFIVRSIDHILRTEFDCPDGLADTGTMEWKGETVPKVQILDPATGTGTFLQYVIQVIWDTFYQKHKKISAAERKARWNRYVSEHLLPRLHGFELMMAPYTIAHMKLGLKLKETGYDFGSDERLRVYLTNALQPTHEVPRTETPALAHEAEQAGRAKTEFPITIVIGNPPYAGISSNRGFWIKDLLKGIHPSGQKISNYYEIDGKSLGEKKLWLQDDYVKFIRYGHYIIDETGFGVLGFITNNGYINSPTFRGMRNQLLSIFDDIYILNLHGNSKQKETAPDGSQDINVFDIQQGVCIGIFVRKNNKKRSGKIHYLDVWGSRERKYEFLTTQNAKSLSWDIFQPREPFYQFVHQDVNIQKEYQNYWKITNFMQVTSVGVQTSRDEFVADADYNVLLERITEFRNIEIPDTLIREKYFQGKGSSKYPMGDTRGWKLPYARKNLQKDTLWKNRIIPYHHRPFSILNLYYSPWMLDWPRTDVMKHLLGGKNLGFITARSNKSNQMDQFLVSQYVSDVKCGESTIGSYMFPLYLYPSSEENMTKQQSFLNTNLWPPGENGRTPNFTQDFVREFEKSIEMGFGSDGSGDLQSNFGPEDIINYMYAVFYSPIYRKRYAEFLKIDFPRLPLTSNGELFRQLCGLGADLVALHLLDDDYKAASWNQENELSPLQYPITTFIEGLNGSTMGTFSKRKVYDDGRVYIDTSLGKASSYFEGVPEDVWNFHIGGYQVLYKWLYDRRGKKSQPGRTLTTEDIEHYQRIVVALKETIRLMEEIDSVIDEHGGWPIH